MRHRPRFRPAPLRLEARDVPSTLVYSGTNQRALVYDPGRDLLYITTSTGTIERFDAVNNVLLSPIAVPGAPTLNGADITPDGTVLVVADNGKGATQKAAVHRIDLTTGTNTDLSYTAQSGEAGSFGVAAVS